jgi:hypothetical protein
MSAGASAPESMMSSTSLLSRMSSGPATTRTLAVNPAIWSACRMAAALPISTGRHTACSRPDAQALATTSGPTPQGSPTTTPTGGRLAASIGVAAAIILLRSFTAHHL